MSGPGRGTGAALRAAIAYRTGSGATYRERVRLAAFLAANPDARVCRGDFRQWYADLPGGTMHAPTLGRLLDRLDEMDGPDSG